MLQMSEEKYTKIGIPPRLEQDYTAFKLIHETSSYSKLFEAQHRKSAAIHTIKVFNTTKLVASKNNNLASKLFIQELFYTASKHSKVALLNTFEISNKSRLIAYVSLPCYPVNLYSDQHRLKLLLKDPNMIAKMIKDIITDVEYLWKFLKLRNIINHLNYDSIYFLEDRGAFFLGNWTKILETESCNDLSPANIHSTISEANKHIKSRSLLEEIKGVITTVLELRNTSYLDTNAMQNPTNDSFDIKSALENISKESEQLHQLIERILNRDPQNSPAFEEFKADELDITKDNYYAMTSAEKLESYGNSYAQNNSSLQSHTTTSGKNYSYFIVILIP